jgi:hypothetical protein
MRTFKLAMLAFMLLAIAAAGSALPASLMPPLDRCGGSARM